MGYSSFGSESLNPTRANDQKEAFNVRWPPQHQTDFRGCPNSFKEVAGQLQTLFQKLSRAYAVACALALGFQNDLDMFAKTLSTMDLCSLARQNETKRNETSL